MSVTHHLREIPPLRDLLFSIDEPLSSLCERLDPQPEAQLRLIVGAVPGLKEILGPLPADAGEPDEAVRAKEAVVTVTCKLWMLRNSVSVCSDHLGQLAKDCSCKNEEATYIKQRAAVDAFGLSIDMWLKSCGTEGVGG